MKPLTSKELRMFNRATKCHICLKEFQEKEIKVRYHCHYTRRYRGPAHRDSNLRYKIPSYIPIVFHNLSRYGAHLFITELGKKGNIGVIAKTMENYISFTIDVKVDIYQNRWGEIKDRIIQLRIIDSVKFMASSLDSLTNNLVRRGQPQSGFERYNEEQYELLIRKGVYPYEYMDSWDRLKETHLPPKEAFYSKLNMRGISKEDYEHAKRVWKAFGINDIGEYHNLYLKTDVILLNNVFKAFRSTCLEHYKLDPAHFYTSPGLAWQACLKKTGVKLELLTDPDMLLMFELGIRGGISQAVHRYARANNKYMGDKFVPKECTSFLQYLDANSLYGWAMSQLLPTGVFRWVNVNPKDISRLTKRKDKGYLLEVDVKYPQEWHVLHNDLQFKCEKMKINKVEKLVLNLHNKKN